MDEEEIFLAALERVRHTHAGNRCAKYMSRELFMSFDAGQRRRLYRCCRSGVENPDSVIGCYVMHPGDLHEFRAFFGPLIRDCHRAPATARHATGWEPHGDEEHDAWDISTLGLPELSIRLRVGRNLKAFNLPGSMDRAERIRFEKSMVQALQSLIDHPDYGGRIHSLTPEFGPGEPNPNLITPREYRDLVDAHIMFKSMDADPYLTSAGLSSDWPYGRACYVSGDKEVIVWIGEEDQLRIMCMMTGTKLMDVFDQLRDVLSMIEAIPGIEFEHDETYGYVTSCPSNLGTGMRASVHVLMPHLAGDGVDVKATCERFGLSVCGIAGDHAPIGADGTLDLSPTRRLFVRERDIIGTLFEGIRQLASVG